MSYKNDRYMKLVKDIDKSSLNKKIGLALINLIIIIAFIVFLMKVYLKINRISYYLMAPYLLWSIYALILNSSIFLLN